MCDDDGGECTGTPSLWCSWHLTSHPSLYAPIHRYEEWAQLTPKAPSPQGTLLTVVSHDYNQDGWAAKCRDCEWSTDGLITDYEVFQLAILGHLADVEAGISA